MLDTFDCCFFWQERGGGLGQNVSYARGNERNRIPEFEPKRLEKLTLLNDQLYETEKGWPP